MPQKPTMSEFGGLQAREMWVGGEMPGRCWQPVVLCTFQDCWVGFPGRGLMLVLEASGGAAGGDLSLAAVPAAVPGWSLDIGCGLQHALAGTSGGAGLWGRPERTGRQDLCLGEALLLLPPQLLRTFPCKGSEQNGAGNCWFSRTLSRDAVVTPKGLCRHLANQEPACSPCFGAESPRLGPSLGELSSVCHRSENHLWLEVVYECPLLRFVGATGPRAAGGCSESHVCRG